MLQFFSARNKISYLRTMYINRKIPFDNGLFFIIFTCCKLLYFFVFINGYNVVYNSFSVLKKHGGYNTALG